MEKKILVLMGGVSQEKEISINSGEAIYNALKASGYKVDKYILTESMDSLIAYLLAHKDEIIVFNMLHGGVGEDGRIPALLDLLSINYTHSGSFTSSIAMNKVMAKVVAKSLNIKVAQDQTIGHNICEQDVKIPYPFILKPIAEGSSVGLYLIHNFHELIQALSNLIQFQELMIEEFINGVECTVGVLDGEALAVTEIISNKGQLFNYESKYTVGGADHILPANNIHINTQQLMLDQSAKLFKAIKARGLFRVDFICNENGAYFLEVNTHPGMTNVSLFPEQAQYKGISFIELCKTLISLASHDS